MKNKRGLSDVITVVLIILLAIVAVGIIWLVISRTLKSTEGSIDASQFTVKMEIVDNYVKVNEGSRTISVNVRRSPGTGDVRGVRVVLEDDNGQTFSYLSQGVINEFETKTIAVQYPITFGSPTKILIYPVFLRTDGKESTGEVVDEYTIRGDEGGDIPESCGNGICAEGEICAVDCTTEQYCTDGVDNNGNDLVDCADQGCDGSDGCEYGTERTCDDAKDNDADGNTDCADSDCASVQECGETSCTDDIDNNGNGLTDCAEASCQQSEPTCKEVRVFVSSARYNGNLGGLAGADQKCQDLANLAVIGGTWKAWLSDSTTSAATRLFQSRWKYKLVDGTVVANNWTDLTDGSILAQIDRTETNINITAATKVYTQTTASGDIAPLGASCSDWTTGNLSISARTGEAISSDLDQKWTDKATTGCGNNIRIYCFEQP